MTEHNRNKAMSNVPAQAQAPGQPVVYQIRLKGHLSSQWTDRFGGLSITLADNGDTLLTGPVMDQAALHGLLKTARDLGLPLISLNPVVTGPPGAIEMALTEASTAHKRAEDIDSQALQS